MGSQSIKLKAVIDKEKNRVILAESEGDFIDVLLSFLTMPMGTIIRLTRTQLPSIGCMNNLYASVENLDVRRFRTQACKEMLLHPLNGAATHCNYLKLKIDYTTENLQYLYCGDSECLASKHKLFTHYGGSFCGCGKPMAYSLNQLYNAESNNIVVSDPRDEGVFVRGLTRLIISDELHLMPPSDTASFSLLAKHGVMDANTMEERTFDVHVNEVFNLLKSTLVSKTPLTETLLKQQRMPEPRKEDLGVGWFIKQKIGEHATEGDRKICVRLVLSKSKKMVCYAEAAEDFVDLLFSFLTIPLGFIVKEMRGYPSKGCITHLYDSVEELDTEKYFKSNDHKETLLSPKMASRFGYKNQLIGVEEVNQQYYLSGDYPRIFTHKPTNRKFSTLTMNDPKAPLYKEQAISNGGFVLGPETFTVTDDLGVTPISPVLRLSVLSKLKVPFSDIEERIVHVGNEEALRLLVASFISESALTDTFTPKGLEQEY
ncbi:hypothetical protein P3X46_015683 [Hevea brasiliensis]|uniref:DUF674 family protein n=1 Tax=Hevea brasiliensis TaxID=3981 RepID=A0ABQ9M0Q4_HEVBR|nr:uncharacterized protein LOC110640650 [Hevea brasiliensis]KAJ9172446.1 hypothetical protein P3X46_015683 [Hevea brasiliensis]